MYGYHKYNSSTCSGGIQSIQFTTSPENCAQLVQNMFWIFLLADKVWTGYHQYLCIWCLKQWIFMYFHAEVQL